MKLMIVVLALFAFAAPAAAEPGGGGDLSGQIAAVAHPLENEEHLAPLIERAGEARSVLLGEASHGTREFYTWRAAISRRLIEHHGFRFIAVEGDWGSLLRVNQYVKHESDAYNSAREVLLTMDRWPRWMWANEEVEELVEWLRAYNADREPGERVGFYGIDVYGLADSIQATPEFVRKFDDDLAERVKKAYACIAPYADNPAVYIRSIMLQGPCGKAVEEVAGVLRKRSAEFREIDAAGYFHAIQNAMVVKRAEQFYRFQRAGDQRSWNARAGHFADTVERLQSFYGEGTRGIVWAHNTHVGDVRATRNPPAMQNIGRILRERQGADDVFIVGFGSHRGTVVAARQWEGARQVMQSPRGAPGSLEDVLFRMELTNALLFTSDLAGIPALQQPIGHRAIGVVYNPAHERRGNYVPTLFPRRYDAFLFLEETRALSPLHESE